MQIRHLSFFFLLCAAVFTSSAQAQLTVRANLGVTDADEAGASASLSTTVARNLAGPQSSLLYAVDLGLDVSYLAAAGGGVPCPPNADRCPRGTDWIIGVLADIGLFKAGPLQLWGTVGGGLASGSEGERTDPDQTVFGARSAGAIIYGATAEYWLNQVLSVHAQYQGFSVLTGEREFIGPIGPFTIDVGTESLNLVSAGVGIRL